MVVKGTLRYVFAAILLGAWLSFLPTVLRYAAINTSPELTIFLGLFGMIVLFICIGTEGLLRKRRDIQEVMRGTSRMWSKRASSVVRSTAPVSLRALQRRRMEVDPQTGLRTQEYLEELLPKTNEKNLKKQIASMSAKLERNGAERMGKESVVRAITRCSDCGKVLADNFEFCPECGARLSRHTPQARTFKRT